MLPIPTQTALAAFTGALLMLSVGILFAAPVPAALGGTALAYLAVALAATMPLGRRVRRQRLEFAWWLAHGDPSAGGGAVVPDAPFEIRCYIRHRGSVGLWLSELRPIVPGGAKILEGSGSILRLTGRARTEFGFRLVAPAAGRVVLHGLAVSLRGPLSLFEVPLYFPNPLTIKVLPRAARHRALRHRAASAGSDRSGPTVLRRRGGGTELYELRELVPGDPFKSIAWKASARAGKLMVKEVEHEVQRTRWIVLDVSGTMRGGDAGARKLDYAIETAAAQARVGLDDGDRVGLVTVDGRIVDFVPARDGAAHAIRVYEALLAATEVVDLDLTDVDDEDVAAIVGRYVRNQDGVDYGRPAGRWDVVGLTRHVQAALEQVEAKALARDRPQASHSAGATLRRFCRARGIPLPYRPDPRDGTKAPGLGVALTRIAGASRDPSSILVITDFDGTKDFDPLEAAVRFTRLHRHSVTFLVPDAATFAPPPDGPLGEDLHTVYGHGETRRLRTARQALGRLGAEVLSSRQAHRRKAPKPGSAAA